LRQVTSHCYLRGHVFKLEVVNNQFVRDVTTKKKQPHMFNVTVMP
jgi:hypothetical protein